jgi:hypothetical protein
VSSECTPKTLPEHCQAEDIPFHNLWLAYIHTWVPPNGYMGCMGPPGGCGAQRELWRRRRSRGAYRRCDARFAATPGRRQPPSTQSGPCQSGCRQAGEKLSALITSTNLSCACCQNALAAGAWSIALLIKSLARTSTSFQRRPRCSLLITF